MGKGNVESIWLPPLPLRDHENKYQYLLNFERYYWELEYWIELDGLDIIIISKQLYVGCFLIVITFYKYM